MRAVDFERLMAEQGLISADAPPLPLGVGGRPWYVSIVLGGAGWLASFFTLFFVVILGHIDLRSKLTSSEIIYLEYFFFVMYLAILAVSVNSILFVSHANVSLIQYKDNFIPKLLYWPVIASLLLGVTLWVFY